ncbi:hypothetical protein U879_12100 [Defluviimonas sp. 20V17]|uniref:Gene transfer agent protein n=1 Tax=Allgaiera indica TaxID=765699 RepID=A0AAN4ZZJ6_9RHOB|nr:hypothetical protein [Allgaiera indica]KDB03406.1 hypothetical protein U879_12100 [Defluviimonas sp. 20V17]GHE00299.1 hypothetical protein GCM10008024_11250 [Allgaiera indica]SDW64084.1 hypothetical protein SAMN05444006_105188 [Allgaiera indica]
MTGRRPPGGGSRFLYDSFDAAHARIEANERVAEERWQAIETRLRQIEAMLDRMERRIWMAVYGALLFMLAQGAGLVVDSLLK